MVIARRTIPLLEKTAVFSKTIDGIPKFNVVIKTKFKIKPMIWNKLNYVQNWFPLHNSIADDSYNKEEENRHNFVYAPLQNAGIPRKREEMFFLRPFSLIKMSFGHETDCRSVVKWEWLFTLVTRHSQSNSIETNHRTEKNSVHKISGDQLCYLVSKTQKHWLHWNNSSLENLVTYWLTCYLLINKFHKHQDFRNQKFDSVWLSHYYCVSSICFDCRTQSNSIHGLSSIKFDLVRLTMSGFI